MANSPRYEARLPVRIGFQSVQCGYRSHYIIMNDQTFYFFGDNAYVRFLNPPDFQLTFIGAIKYTQ